MIRSVMKLGASAVLLTFVVMTSVLRFHHHDCHGHMSFAFSGANAECVSPDIHLYSSSGNEAAHDHHSHNHFCPIIVEFQAEDDLRTGFDWFISAFIAVLPSYSFDFSPSAKIVAVIPALITATTSTGIGRSVSLRAPPVML